MTPNWKPSRTARKIKERQTKLDRKATERKIMNEVRKRDRVCRFPMCGCKKLGLNLEVAHLRHRGMGGNPLGDRTNTAEMILLCSHRHQFGGVSLHRGTLRIVPLTEDGCDGPVRFEVDGDASGFHPSAPGGESTWVVLGAEAMVSTPMQLRRMSLLAKMED